MLTSKDFLLTEVFSQINNENCKDSYINSSFKLLKNLSSKKRENTLSTSIKNIMIDINQYTVEELANALYCKCQFLEVEKGTDKTKWREIVIAEKLGHKVHSKISAGKGTKEYGSDAFNPELSSFEEYKSQILSDKDLRNLLELPKGNKGKTYAPLTISGVYNGYNSNYEVASVEYPKKGHYFAVFYEELCVLIVKVSTDYVMKSLNENYNKFISNGKKGSTNLNTVMVNLADTHLYTVAYKNEEFYDSKR